MTPRGEHNHNKATRANPVPSDQSCRNCPCRATAVAGPRHGGHDGVIDNLRSQSMSMYNSPVYCTLQYCIYHESYLQVRLNLICMSVRRGMLLMLAVKKHHIAARGTVSSCIDILHGCTPIHRTLSLIMSAPINSRCSKFHLPLPSSDSGSTARRST